MELKEIYENYGLLSKIKSDDTVLDYNFSDMTTEEVNDITTFSINVFDLYLYGKRSNSDNKRTEI